MKEFMRTEILFGEENFKKLESKRVIVFGIGGVGGHVVEALARSGVGYIEIVDHDKVDITNINRQIVALHSTIGRDKVDVMEERIKDINPDCIVVKRRTFFLPENSHEFDFSQYDYVVDAVDTVTAKIEIVMTANKAGVPIISSMGTGNKWNPMEFEVADIYKTSMCPLAKVMRRELKKRGVRRLKCLYSKEEVKKPKVDIGAPGSNAFTPSVAGLIIASEVIKELCEI
ncbi:tRNA threonylcarbamoyladenosine dehydratase [Eubacterium xylanophilum]|uniref:tRNA threonylcarbamoyladenosine dehydratase n=1 Tax=Eubacterium xylanophilum TaxID=39497 RepID=UPI00047AF374|nr:tRNA threonylcarbamoyladenosine dehydratase [Eubacterium xylanophilum]MCR5798403.1 tRNA threonylcarbamoyladenosine dehydratase [Eubacterium sp.]